MTRQQRRKLRDHILKNYIGSDWEWHFDEVGLTVVHKQTEQSTRFDGI